MSKKIEDYLHLYKNVRAQVVWGLETKIETILSVSDGGINIAQGGGSAFRSFYGTVIKPILRPLSDMSEEEKKQRDNLLTKGTDGVHSVIIFTPNCYSFKFLLDKRFDLFGLIESGLALDSTKLKEHEGYKNK